MVLIYLVLVLAMVINYLLNKRKQKYNYWKNKGVAQIDPNFIYGNTKEIALRKITPSELYREFYYKFKKLGVKYGGIYNFSKPVWVLVNPDIIKLVLITDFQNFNAHNPKISNTLFFNNLFHMNGEPWKDMRRKLTPTFTSGKMKMMFDILAIKTIGLSDLVSDMIKSGEPAEIKELLARYTTDVIGTCGFGIECDSINNINSEFFQQGQNLFKKLLPQGPPKLLSIFLLASGLVRFKIADISESEDFFRNVVLDTIKYREENKVVRKDFLHLMIQLKNKGSITDLVNEKDVYKGSEDEDQISMEDLAGQCVLFFAAGFETSSTTMSFALLELAQNQDIQARLRQEIQQVLKKYNGNLTYDAVQDMVYCDNVVKETLRKYPPVSNLPRMCTKNYIVPNTDLEIEKGTMVQIPLLAIQNDPEYFPQPEKFDPDRFSLENRDNIRECTYMPFGEGPRQCLGLRFGVMQSKAGLATLINRYNFTLNKKTSYPPKFSTKAPVLSTEGGIWLDAAEVKY